LNKQEFHAALRLRCNSGGSSPIGHPTGFKQKAQFLGLGFLLFASRVGAVQFFSYPAQVSQEIRFMAPMQPARFFDG
jgi:hypothetical protein